MKEETLEFLNRAKAKGSVLGLSNMRLLMESLGNVQEQLPIIHIGGTNGKGSVGAYLASIFTEAGLTVGRYTSPAVFDPMEVFTIGGIPMEQSVYEELAEEIRVRISNDLAADGQVNSDCDPTIFELETAMAFLWFYKEKPDLVLLECGMGGETDATNVISTPLAAVLTSISLDHTAILGDSTAEIARVKAGIMKKDCPVFSADQDKNATSVLLESAGEKAVSGLTFVKAENISVQEESPERLCFTYLRKDEKGRELSLGLETHLAGHYQCMNAALAAETAIGLWDKLGLVEENMLDNISDGIYQAAWPGRFEVVGRNPYIILDGAHNPGAAEELVKTIKNCFGDKKLVLILGVLADKDHRRLLEILLPQARAVFTVTPSSPRAMDGEKLAREAESVLKAMGREKVSVLFAHTLSLALETGEKLAREADCPVLACGSLSYLGDFRKIADLQLSRSDI